MSRQHAVRDLRTDIQALRAVAVGMVVLYHLHPAALPGGFVGVDVFLVISGFLITAHLLRRPPTRPGDLAAFWGRRIRRLLPASLLVLACTLLAVRAFAPETQWEPTAVEARAAALYVVNWVLAGRAVDYLAQDSDPTAVQHYWSLSVEEQFYLFWPVLIAIVVLTARRLRLSPRGALSVALGAVVAASFAYSVARTASDPGAAYFVTTTRIWELGAGGLLALAASRTGGRRLSETAVRALRAVAAWSGLAMIVATGFLYSGAGFPGYRAALPVVGTLLVIAAAPVGSDRAAPGRLLAVRPMQWLGDISYSVYLWHWPLVVLVPYALGRTLGLPDLIAVLAATLALAALTERWVERPFRTPRAARSGRTTYVAAGAAMAVVIGLATTQLAEVHRSDERARTELAQAVREGGPCFGASALDPGSDCPPVAFDDVVPAPILAAADKSAAYRDVGGRQCWSYIPGFPDRTCRFGVRRSEVTIALVGNSHAGQWLPALEAIAAQHGYRIVTHLASQCASADVPQTFRTEAGTAGCQDWVRRTTAALVVERPDLVVMSNRISVPVVGHSLGDSREVYTAGLSGVLDSLLDADLSVLAIRDTPAAGTPVPTCVAEHQDDYTSCDGTRADWLPDDPVLDAVRELDDPRVRAVDLTDHICEPVTCHAVTGGVITYFDGSHLTATYSHTLAPYLAPAIAAMLP